MAFTFNVPEGETIARELLIAYLNTGTDSSPVWSPLGKRTTDSSEEFDWGEENSQDILGNTYPKMKKPTITQTFDPWDLDGGTERPGAMQYGHDDRALLHHQQRQFRRQLCGAVQLLHGQTVRAWR